MTSFSLTNSVFIAVLLENSYLVFIGRIPVALSTLSNSLSREFPKQSHLSTNGNLNMRCVGITPMHLAKSAKAPESGSRSNWWQVVRLSLSGHLESSSRCRGNLSVMGIISPTISIGRRTRHGLNHSRHSFARPLSEEDRACRMPDRTSLLGLMLRGHNLCMARTHITGEANPSRHLVLPD